MRNTCGMRGVVVTVVPPTLTLANAEGAKKFGVELYEYANDNDEDMSIEVYGD